jgi:hypothetical protein
VDVAIEFFELLSFSAFRSLNTLPQIMAYRRKTMLSKLGNELCCFCLIVKCAPGCPAQMEPIQDELLGYLQAIKAVPYPLIAISTTDHSLRLAEIIVKMAFPYDFFLPLL